MIILFNLNWFVRQSYINAHNIFIYWMSWFSLLRSKNCIQFSLFYFKRIKLSNEFVPFTNKYEMNWVFTAIMGKNESKKWTETGTIWLYLNKPAIIAIVVMELKQGSKIMIIAIGQEVFFLMIHTYTCVNVCLILQPLAPISDPKGWPWANKTWFIIIWTRAFDCTIHVSWQLTTLPVTIWWIWP